MKITITLITDNAAFEDDPGEVARILRKLADDTEKYPPTPGDGLPLFDVNGNRTGQYKVSGRKRKAEK